MTPKQFKTYLWLIELLDENPGITFKKISDEWAKKRELSKGAPMNRRSFFRYRDDLKQSLGLDIVCDNHTDYGYRIKNENAIRDNSIYKWMVTTISMGNQLKDCVGLSDRIILEDMPSGEKWLLRIIRAMKENRRIEITYRRYGNKESWKAVVSPYFLKVYNKRWYLFGKIDKEKLYTLPLDRMLEVEVTDKVFEVDDKFNAEDYFKDMYGIFRDDKSRKQKVVLRAFGDEYYYLNDLPLHHSQKAVNFGDGFFDFELNLHITKELTGFILSRGKRLKVISPKKYAQEIEEEKG